MEKIILQGIAFDDKSSFLKGPAKAPPLIRECYQSKSANYFGENGMEIRPEKFIDKGDLIPVQYYDIESFTLDNLKQKLKLLTLGGDHSITYPVFRAFTRAYGPVDILQIDAHTDLYNEFEGDRYSHACPFARIMEEGLCGRLIQLGVRTMTQHQKEQAERFGVEVIPAAGFSPDRISEIANPLYLSLDLDVLDPCFAPGISHYEPGGLSSRQLFDIIGQIKAPLVGADIVEYNPDRDIQMITGMLAAKCLKEIAAKMLES